MKKKNKVNAPTPTPLSIANGVMFEAKVVGPLKGGERDIVYQGNLATAKRVMASYNNFEPMLEALRCARTSLKHFRLGNYESTTLTMIDRIITKAERDDS